MGINNAIKVVAILTLIAAGTGKLPRLVRAVQIAQLKLLKQSQSASWGKAILLPPSK